MRHKFAEKISGTVLSGLVSANKTWAAIAAGTRRPAEKIAFYLFIMPHFSPGKKLGKQSERPVFTTKRTSKKSPTIMAGIMNRPRMAPRIKQLKTLPSRAAGRILKFTFPCDGNGSKKKQQLLLPKTTKPVYPPL